MIRRQFIIERQWNLMNQKQVKVKEANKEKEVSRDTVPAICFIREKIIRPMICSAVIRRSAMDEAGLLVPGLGAPCKEHPCCWRF